MMKKILIALALAVAATPAFASQGTATVTAEATSDAMYRGKSFTDGKPALSAGLRLDDLVVDGTFATISGTTVDVGNLDREGRLRTEYAVGYGRTFGDLSVAGSVARVENPILYTRNYTEGRLDASYAMTEKLAVTGQFAQILTDAVGQDRYASVGVEYKGLFVDNLSIAGLLSYQDYKVADRKEFNNAEVHLTYAFNPHVEAFGMYSWGGTSFAHAVDALDIDFRTSSLKDQGLVGVRVKF